MHVIPGIIRDLEGIGVSKIKLPACRRNLSFTGDLETEDRWMMADGRHLVVGVVCGRPVRQNNIGPMACRQQLKLFLFPWVLIFYLIEEFIFPPLDVKTWVKRSIWVDSTTGIKSHLRLREHWQQDVKTDLKHSIELTASGVPPAIDRLPPIILLYTKL